MKTWFPNKKDNRNLFFVLAFIPNLRTSDIKNFKTISRMENFQDFLFMIKRSAIIPPENYSLKLPKKLKGFSDGSRR